MNACGLPCGMIEGWPRVIHRGLSDHVLVNALLTTPQGWLWYFVHRGIHEPSRSATGVPHIYKLAYVHGIMAYVFIYS